MKNRFSRHFPASKVMARIWISTAGVALACILAVVLLWNHLYARSTISRSLNQAEYNTAAAASTVTESIDRIVHRYVNICGGSEFISRQQGIRNCTTLSYAQENNNLQEVLYELANVSPFVSTALITTPAGFAFHLAVDRLQTNVLDTLFEEARALTGITFFEVCANPIRGQADTMMMAIPMTFSYGTRNAEVASDPEKADAVIWMVLDLSYINNTLRLYANASPHGILYITDADGAILNFPVESILEPLALHTPLNNGRHDEKDYTVFTQSISDRDIYIVGRYSAESLRFGTVQSLTSVPFIIGAILLMVLFATLFSAVFLSRPLTRLSASVTAIETGNYDSSMVLTQKDEIGDLSASIDEMYHTIERQIDEIRIERAEKYNLEIRLLAEQINPHFLYNTLEYINFEVYNRHTENASLMIQSLGDFLRLGLNFGDDLVTVSHELDHVQAYINIMNHRFSHDISFVSECPEHLKDRQILKVILQPLVENSIRHGFQLEGNSLFLDIPTITISCKEHDNELQLSVIDNGIGFDVEKTNAIMHTSGADARHVGLNNVWQRLQAFYGPEAEITFQSIPYYKNRVVIHIPRHPSTEGKEPIHG